MKVSQVCTFPEKFLTSTESEKKLTITIDEGIDGGKAQTLTFDQKFDAQKNWY